MKKITCLLLVFFLVGCRPPLIIESDNIGDLTQEVATLQKFQDDYSEKLSVINQELVEKLNASTTEKEVVEIFGYKAQEYNQILEKIPTKFKTETAKALAQRLKGAFSRVTQLLKDTALSRLSGDLVQLNKISKQSQQSLDEINQLKNDFQKVKNYLRSHNQEKGQ